MTQRQIGILQLLLAGAFFGFLGIFGKQAFVYGISTGELLSLRFLSASFLMSFYFLFIKKNILKTPIKQIFISILMGVLGYAVFSSFYFMALQGLSASLTVLLLYTYPVLVSIGAYYFFNEKLKLSGVYALLLAFFGIVMLVWGEWSFSESKFLFYGLASSFFYAIYVLISRKYLATIDVLISSFFVQLGAGSVLFLLYFKDFARPQYLMNEHWLFIFAMAIVCSVLPLSLFLAGLQKLKSAEASIFSMGEPIFGVLIASIFLGEQMKALQIFGAIIMLFALYIIAKNKS